MTTTRSDEAAARKLLSAAAVRERAHEMLALGEADALAEWKVDLSRLPDAAAYVAEVVRETYPGLKVPFHARWRHFNAGGRDLWAEAEKPGIAPALARTGFDLAICSVLLDAGAGSKWSYRDAATGAVLSRSEGLGVASLRMFQSGALSSEPSDRLRADALYRVDAKLIAEHFQVSDRNPLIGVPERAKLLTQLGRAVGQPAALFDILVRHSDKGRLPAATILEVLLQALGPIWPGRAKLGDIPLGDCWTHPALDGFVPLHKLSQWMAYSLIEPLQWGGIEVVEIDGLTGLAEYRNGGLFVDLGVLSLRDPDTARRAFGVESPTVVAWRAMTVALLDRLAPLVREALGVTQKRFPLACVLEGGTWSAGRRIAAARRPGGAPPLSIISDGTVF